MINLNESQGISQLSNLISVDSALIGETGGFHTTSPQEVVSFSGFYYDTSPNLWLVKDSVNGSVTHYPQARSFRMNIGTGATDAINTKLGEVQASPTANTVLARLKTIADALVSGIKLAAGASIIAPLTGIRLDAGQSLKMSGITDATGGNPRVHGSFDLELIRL